MVVVVPWATTNTGSLLTTMGAVTVVDCEKSITAGVLPLPCKNTVPLPKALPEVMVSAAPASTVMLPA